MYYELYVDSLFWVNFVMNLYLLMLVNHRVMRTATRRSLVGGAGVGALCYLLPFLVPLPAWIKYPTGLLAGTWLMIYIAFRPGNGYGYFKILKYLLGYSFLMGGLLLFINRAIPVFGEVVNGIWTVGGIGALAVMGISFLGERQRDSGGNCMVTLVNGDRRVTVRALLDSGNGLIEPISGEPVTVIDREIYRALWGEAAQIYRAIPYHNISCRRGILNGYLLPRMDLEIDGITKSFQGVYVAVAKESGKIPVIINPTLLEENGTNKKSGHQT